MNDENNLRRLMIYLGIGFVGYLVFALCQKKVGDKKDYMPTKDAPPRIRPW